MDASTQEAHEFLKLHSGCCSVLEGSKFMEGFMQLFYDGEVTISPSGTAGYVDIRACDFKPRFSIEE